jgi:glutaredoxin 3
MATVEIFTAALCPFCSAAKKLLKSKGIDFSEVDVTFNPKKRKELARAAGKTSVPQIWIDGQHVGGCDELYALDAEGRLDPMLQKAS